MTVKPRMHTESRPLSLAPEPLHNWAIAGKSTYLNLKQTLQPLAGKPSPTLPDLVFRKNSKAPMLRHAVHYHDDFQPHTWWPNISQSQSRCHQMHWSRKSLTAIERDSRKCWKNPIRKSNQDNGRRWRKRDSKLHLWTESPVTVSALTMW